MGYICIYTLQILEFQIQASSTYIRSYLFKLLQLSSYLQNIDNTFILVVVYNFRCFRINNMKTTVQLLYKNTVQIIQFYKQIVNYHQKYFWYRFRACEQIQVVLLIQWAIYFFNGGVEQQEQSNIEDIINIHIDPEQLDPLRRDNSSECSED
ncbi:Hypothetical_protein [Hexamita inflata]|uniref:Hypothetical_protein n=1 Tax=Hexamita inflata TaxID=28002 RepID=A0AA86UVD2_9EUKA|nr:Hypothetical protein HINF_LOCUS56954 [Hexamita inflata]